MQEDDESTNLKGEKRFSFGKMRGMSKRYKIRNLVRFDLLLFNPPKLIFFKLLNCRSGESE